MNRTKRIENILGKHLLEFNISVNDNSFSHKGHNNFSGDGETHIEVILQKKSKIKFNRLELHKKINFLLKKEYITGLHSLEIKII